MSTTVVEVSVQSRDALRLRGKLIGSLTAISDGDTLVYDAASSSFLPTAGGGGGSGTVTSVAVTVPSILSLAGSPVTAAGTLALSLATQSANLVWAGPSTGSAAAPAFRSLVAADIPSLAGLYAPLSGSTLTGSLVSVPPTNAYYSGFRLRSLESANYAFGLSVTAYDNTGTGSVRKDDVFQFGYNANGALAGEHSLSWNYENFYNPVSLATSQAEYYLAVATGDGTVNYRPISFNITNATPNAVAFVLTGDLSFVDLSVQQWAGFYSGAGGGITLYGDKKINYVGSVTDFLVSGGSALLGFDGAAGKGHLFPGAATTVVSGDWNAATVDVKLMFGQSEARGFRSNHTTSQMEFSHNGSTWSPFLGNWNTSLGVGGGSGTPSAKVHVVDNGNNFLLLDATGGVTYTVKRSGSTGYLEFGGTQTGFIGYVFGTDLVTNALYLANNGNVGIGTNSFGTSASKVIALANGGAPSTSPTGLVQIYAESGALKCRSSGGTVTTLAEVGSGGAVSYLPLGGGSVTGDVTFSGSIVFSNVITAGGFLSAGATGVQFNASMSRAQSFTNGDIKLSDHAGTAFNLLTLGGTTTSYPALKRSSATLQIRLADDSGFAAQQSLYERFGSGSPESVVTAPIGALFHRTDGGAVTSLYVKESGTGNTGWVAK